MKLVIKEIYIYTKNDSVICHQFNSRISFIYGNVGVGKTTLLSLIMYCLGADIVETPAIIDQFASAELHICIAETDLVLQRNYKSNFVYIDYGNGRTENRSVLEITQKFYSIAHISPLYYEQSIDQQRIEGNVDNTVRKNQNRRICMISWRNYLWYTYLKQTDIDSDFFHLSGNSNSFMQIASINTLASLLGKKGYYKDENKRKELTQLRKRLTQYKNGMIAIDYILGKDFQENFNKCYDILSKRMDYLNEKVKENKYDDCQKFKLEEQELACLKRVLTMGSKYSKYVEQYNLLQKQVQQMAFITEEDDRDYLNHLQELGETFKECLIMIGFPSISQSDTVEFDTENLLPSIKNEFTRITYSFDSLGSGGKKTLFKICFLIALHICANKLPAEENRLPSFIIIDTPMKNISEREDKELFDNFYKYLMELSNSLLKHTQFIIVDKEKNDMVDNCKICTIPISKEHPLFPSFVDANSERGSGYGANRKDA